VSQGGGLCNLPLPKYNTAIAKWQSEQVSTIRLNRPAAFNALNQQLLQELFGTVLAVGSTPDAHAPVNTGKGNTIAAGANIKAIQSMTVQHGLEFTRLGAKAFRHIEKTRGPVIAAINGFAPGGECERALATTLAPHR